MLAGGLASLAASWGSPSTLTVTRLRGTGGWVVPGGRTGTAAGWVPVSQGACDGAGAAGSADWGAAGSAGRGRLR